MNGIVSLHGELTLFMALHAIAHLGGYVMHSGYLGDAPAKTKLFYGRFSLSARGNRFAATVWLVAAVAFGVVAVGVGLRAPWWQYLAPATILCSLLLCLWDLPETKVGALMNLALGGWVLDVLWLHWFARL